MNPWDARYSADTFFYGTEPNDFLVATVKQLGAPGGAILSLGEGEGRNAVFLAGKGFAVTALDASTVGLRKAEQLAAQRGVSIKQIAADVSSFNLGSAQYDAIISIFCHLPRAVRRAVHSRAQQALKRGGTFVLEGYSPQQLQYGTGGPKDLDLLYTAEELRGDFADSEVLHLAELEREVFEGTGHGGRAAVVQLIARRR